MISTFRSPGVINGDAQFSFSPVYDSVYDSGLWNSVEYGEGESSQLVVNWSYLLGMSRNYLLGDARSCQVDNQCSAFQHCKQKETQ